MTDYDDVIVLLHHLREAHPQHTNSDICPVCLAMHYISRGIWPAEAP